MFHFVNTNLSCMFFNDDFYIYILAVAFTKATCIAFMLYIWPVHSFTGNQIYDLGIAKAMFYCLSYRNEFLQLHCLLRSMLLLF